MPACVAIAPFNDDDNTRRWQTSNQGRYRNIPFIEFSGVLQFGYIQADRHFINSRTGNDLICSRGGKIQCGETLQRPALPALCWLWR
jgi:hypothetical protein